MLLAVFVILFAVLIVAVLCIDNIVEMNKKVEKKEEK